MRYLRELVLPHRAMKAILEEYLQSIAAAGERIERCEVAMRDLLEQWRLAPAVRALMQRIRVAENKDYTREFPGKLVTRIEIVTRSGERFAEMASYPKGHAKNPMSDADVESKFRDLSAGLLTAARADELLKSLWAVDQAKDIGEVLQQVRLEA